MSNHSPNAQEELRSLRQALKASDTKLKELFFTQRSLEEETKTLAGGPPTAAEIRLTELRNRVKASEAALATMTRMQQVSQEALTSAHQKRDELFKHHKSAIAAMERIADVADAAFDEYANEGDQLNEWQRLEVFKVALDDIRETALTHRNASNWLLEPEPTGRADYAALIPTFTPASKVASNEKSVRSEARIPQQQAPKTPLKSGSTPATGSRATSAPVPTQPTATEPSPPASYSKIASAPKARNLPATQYPQMQGAVQAAKPATSQKLRADTGTKPMSMDKPGASRTPSGNFPPLSQSNAAGQAASKMPKGTVVLPMPNNQKVKGKPVFNRAEAKRRHEEFKAAGIVPLSTEGDFSLEELIGIKFFIPGDDRRQRGDPEDEELISPADKIAQDTDNPQSDEKTSISGAEVSNNEVSNDPLGGQAHSLDAGSTEDAIIESLQGKAVSSPSFNLAPTSAIGDPSCQETIGFSTGSSTGKIAEDGHTESERDAHERDAHELDITSNKSDGEETGSIFADHEPEAPSAGDEEEDTASDSDVFFDVSEQDASEGDTSQATQAFPWLGIPGHFEPPGAFPSEDEGEDQYSVVPEDIPTQLETRKILQKTPSNEGPSMKDEMDERFQETSTRPADLPEPPSFEHMTSAEKTRTEPSTAPAETGKKPKRFQTVTEQFKKELIPAADQSSATTKLRFGKVSFADRFSGLEFQSSPDPWASLKKTPQPSSPGAREGQAPLETPVREIAEGADASGQSSQAKAESPPTATASAKPKAVETFNNPSKPVSLEQYRAQPERKGVHESQPVPFSNTRLTGLIPSKRVSTLPKGPMAETIASPGGVETSTGPQTTRIEAERTHAVPDRPSIESEERTLSESLSTKSSVTSRQKMPEKTPETTVIPTEEVGVQNSMLSELESLSRVDDFSRDDSKPGIRSFFDDLVADASHKKSYDVEPEDNQNVDIDLPEDDTRQEKTNLFWADDIEDEGNSKRETHPGAF